MIAERGLAYGTSGVLERRRWPRLVFMPNLRQDQVMRSLPEKTLEHWTSLYLSSRFPRASQWWPGLGEDVALALRSSLTAPGKVILLEVKVPEVTSAGHTVSIKTAQLRTYLGRRLPVFYVLPVPFWGGPLGGPGSTVPLLPAGWWRRRAGPQWFGNWTYVLPASAVAAAVTMTAANPVLYTVPGSVTPSLPSPLAGALSWSDFWSEIQRCGPEGANRWRVREVHDGRSRSAFSIEDLLDGEQFDLDLLQQEIVLEEGDNLFILNINEEELLPGW
jgi:hypothetical protein